MSSDYIDQAMHAVMSLLSGPDWETNTCTTHDILKSMDAGSDDLEARRAIKGLLECQIIQEIRPGLYRVGRSD